MKRRSRRYTCIGIRRERRVFLRCNVSPVTDASRCAMQYRGVRPFAYRKGQRRNGVLAFTTGHICGRMRFTGEEGEGGRAIERPREIRVVDSAAKGRGVNYSRLISNDANRPFRFYVERSVRGSFLFFFFFFHINTKNRILERLSRRSPDFYTDTFTAVRRFYPARQQICRELAALAAQMGLEDENRMKDIEFAIERERKVPVRIID